jgi:hypothetical protein
MTNDAKDEPVLDGRISESCAIMLKAHFSNDAPSIIPEWYYVCKLRRFNDDRKVDLNAAIDDALEFTDATGIALRATMNPRGYLALSLRRGTDTKAVRWLIEDYFANTIRHWYPDPFVR